MEMPRFEPGAADCEAWTLTIKLCGPPSNPMRDLNARRWTTSSKSSPAATSSSSCWVLDRRSPKTVRSPEMDFDTNTGRPKKFRTPIGMANNSDQHGEKSTVVSFFRMRPIFRKLVKPFCKQVWRQRKSIHRNFNRCLNRNFAFNILLTKKLPL